MSVVKISNNLPSRPSQAVLLLKERVALSERAFAELVIWRLPHPVAGCTHSYKYRIAYVEDLVCIVRFDNEAGKGDHLHIRGRQCPYVFSTLDALKRAFFEEIQRIRNEDGHP